MKVLSLFIFTSGGLIMPQHNKTAIFCLGGRFHQRARKKIRGQKVDHHIPENDRLLQFKGEVWKAMQRKVIGKRATQQLFVPQATQMAGEPAWKKSASAQP